MLFFASSGSAVALLVASSFNGGLSRLKGLSNKEIALFCALGLFNPILYYLVLFNAYDLLKAQEAQPLNYTWPVILTILSIAILRQRSSWRSVTGVLVSFIGVLVISGSALISSDGPDPLGIGLALFSALIWSVYWLISMGSSKGREDLFLLIGFISSIPPLAVITLLYGEGSVLSPTGIGSAIYIGLFEMGITFLVWSVALNLSRETARVANLIYFGPFISLLFIHTILGERILPTTVLGLFLITGGTLLQGRVRGSQS